MSTGSTRQQTFFLWLGGTTEPAIFAGTFHHPASGNDRTNHSASHRQPAITCRMIFSQPSPSCDIGRAEQPASDCQPGIKFNNGKRSLILETFMETNPLMATTIRLGQCWLARLTKCDMFVRIEDYSPKGGWIARSLSHGRVVWIRKPDQLIHRCDENGLQIVADETAPNRRSTALPPKPVVHESESLAVEIPMPKISMRKPEPIQPATLLDATAIVLKVNRDGMSTKEIIVAVQENGLWNPAGKTPWLTLHTALSREIESKGSASRFKKAKERGKFMLR